MSRSIAWLALWFLPAASAMAAEPSARLLNIVVFIADDHSQADCEPYGSREVRTPHLAALARDGLTFSHAFVASPACGPSRTALLTGLWPARNGAEPNHKAKRPDVASLPPVLHSLGYEVAAIGKVAHADYAKDHGFDFVEGPNQGFSEASAVEKFLRQRTPSKPLCLFVGTRHPHVPWSANRAYEPASVQVPAIHIDTPATREQRAGYLTDVTRADELLGDVRRMVQQHVAGETLFLYTSDHGAQWPFMKWNLYDVGTRVPLIAVWPGVLKPGSTSDAMISWPDLLPTFIELAGGDVPEGLDGQSFAGVLKGAATTHRDRIFTTHSGDNDFNVYPIRSVRTRDWKYIRNLHPEFQHHTHISRSTGPSGIAYWTSWLTAAENDPAAAAILKRYRERPAEELFDLTSDPAEQHNLANDPAHAERLAGLRAELDAWMTAQGDRQTVFGNPLLHGQPATPLTPGKKRQPEPPAAERHHDLPDATPVCGCHAPLSSRP